MTKSYRGDSLPVAKIVNITPQNPIVAGQLFTVWSNGKGISYQAVTGDGQTQVVAGLVAAIQASTVPESADYLASAAGSVLVLTAAVAGVPFDVTVTSSGTIAVAETTAGVGATNEVHEIQLLGTYTAGTFTATYNFGAGNVTTAGIAYNAAASAVQTALAALAGVGAANVLVTGGPGPSSPWFVTWLGTFAGAAVTPGTIDGSALTGAGSVTITTQQDGAPSSDCIQQVDLSSASAGTFTLAFQGQTTGALSWGLSAATLQAALQGLSSIGSGNCTVVGEGYAFGYTNSNFYLVQFTGALAGLSLAQITINSGGLSGSGSTALIQQGGATTASGIQFVDLSFSSGTFTITYNGATTAPIAITQPGGSSFYIAVKSALQAITTDTVTVIQGTFYTSIPGNIFGIKLTSHTPAANPVVTVASSNAAVITVLANGIAHQSEIQRVWVAASGGTFTLTLGAQTTSAIAYNAVAGTIQTRVQTDLATTIQACTVTGSGTSASPWIITVTTPAFTNIAPMTGNGASLTGSGSIIEVTAGQAGTNEVQTITAGAGVSGGTFTLSWSGPITEALAWNATSAKVQAALRALSTINTVTVSGSAGGPYTVTWSGAQAAAKQPLIVADGSLLTGATTSLIALSTATWSAGPNHYDDPNNWATVGVPGALDAIYFADGASDCLYGMDQIATFTVNTGTNLGTFTTHSDLIAGQAVYATTTVTLPSPLAANTIYYMVNVNRDAQTFQLSTTAAGTPVTLTTTGSGTHTLGARPASIEINSNYTGSIGLPYENQSNSSYVEYRQRYLHTGLATIANGGLQTIVIGTGGGSGSKKIQINTNIDAVSGKVIQSGGTNENGVNAIIWKGTNAASAWEIIGGDWGSCLYPGEVATLASLKERSGSVSLGSGVTVTGPIDKTGGSIVIDGATINGVVYSR